MTKHNDVISSLLSPKRNSAEQVRPTRNGKQSGRDVAAERELAVMKACAQFGHLRTCEIARLVWPTANYASQMAGRTLNRLSSFGLLAERRNSLATRSFVLTRKGAAWLELRGITARHGLDLSSIAGATFIHRCLGSRFLIEQRLQGANVAGEYQLATGQLPFDISKACTRLAKLPDGIFWRKDAQGRIAVRWLEVENAPKAMAEISRVLAVAELVGMDLGNGAYLEGLTVVANAALHHAGRLLRAAIDRWGNRDFATQATLESRIQIASVELRFPLVWVSQQSCSLHSMRKRPRI